MLLRGATLGAAVSRRSLIQASFSTASVVCDAQTTPKLTPQTAPRLNANGKPKTRGGQNRNKHHPERKFQAPHPQLVQVTSQLATIVEQGDAAEALELLGKSVEFLRQIPEITARALVVQFAALGSSLLEKSADPSVVLATLKEHGVAHTTHYLFVMQAAVAEGKVDEAFGVWVQYKEAVQQSPDVAAFVRAVPFANNDILRTTYLAYALSCLLKNITPEYKTALSVLQVDELPDTNHMRSFMKANPQLLPKGVTLEVAARILRKLNVSALDPNDDKLYLEAERAAKDGKFASVDRIFDVILASDKPVSEATMVRFMNLNAVQGQRYAKALEIFNTLLQSGIQPAVSSFNAVIRTLANFKKQPLEDRLAKVQEVLHTMESLEVAPNKDTYAALIDLNTAAGKFEAVDELYGRVSKTQVVRDAYVASMVARGDLDKAGKVLQSMIVEDDYVPNARVFNKFIQRHIAANDYEQAAASLNALYECGGSPDVATYTMAIDLLFKSSRRNGARPNVSLVVQTLEEMAQHGLPNNVFTLTAIIDGLLKNGTDVEAARAIWAYMQKTLKVTPSKTSYTTMISGELDYGSVERAEALFTEMLGRKEFYKQASDWNLLIIGLLKQGKPAEAQAYFAKMRAAAEKDVKQRPNHYTFGFIMRDAIRRQDWSVVSEAMRIYVEYGLPLTVPLILTIAGSLDPAKVALPAEVVAVLAQESSARYANRKLVL